MQATYRILILSAERKVVDDEITSLVAPGHEGFLGVLVAMMLYGKKHGSSMYGKKHGESMGHKKPGMSMSGEKYDAKQAYNKNLTAKARLHYLENERHDKTHAHPILKHMRKM